MAGDKSIQDYELKKKNLKHNEDNSRMKEEGAQSFSDSKELGSPRCHRNLQRLGS